jgi:hypothetical protein
LDINHQGRLRGNRLTGPRQTRRARAERREPSLARLWWTGAQKSGAPAGMGSADKSCAKLPKVQATFRTPTKVSQMVLCYPKIACSVLDWLAELVNITNRCDRSEMLLDLSGNSSERLGETKAACIRAESEVYATVMRGFKVGKLLVRLRVARDLINARGFRKNYRRGFGPEQ